MPAARAVRAASAAADPPAASSWYAYVLVSFGPSPAAGARPARRPRPRKVVRTYVGVAVDVDRRARQHNGELAGGARSTRAGRPWKVAVIHGPFPDRGAAQAVEYRLKQRRGAAARLLPL